MDFSLLSSLLISVLGRKDGKNTQKNYQITTGTNCAKDTGVSAKRMEIANTLHTILYKNEPTKKEEEINPKASKQARKR